MQIKWHDTENKIFEVGIEGQGNEIKTSSLVCTYLYNKVNLGRYQTLFDSGCVHNLISINHDLVGLVELHKLKLPSRNYSWSRS